MTESRWRTAPARLEELIEEGIIDCHDNDEAHSGMATMLEENVVCPFQAQVMGELVTVTSLEWRPRGYGMNAVCVRGGRERPGPRPARRRPAGQ